MVVGCQDLSVYSPFAPVLCLFNKHAHHFACFIRGDIIGYHLFTPARIDKVIKTKARYLFLFANIEFQVEIDRFREVLKALGEAANRIDTVFSLGVISRVNEDGQIPVLAVGREAGFSIRPNAKVNVGLGRPLAEEA